MNDFTDLIEQVRGLGFKVNLDSEFYFDFESQVFHDGFELRCNDLRLQIHKLPNDEVLISRGAVFTGEAIDFSDQETTITKFRTWTLYRGPINTLPNEIFQTLMNLFYRGVRDEIIAYFLKQRIPATLN